MIFKEFLIRLIR